MSLLTTDTKWFFVFWKLQITFALIHAIITLISYLYTDLYVSLFSPLLNDFSRNFTLSYLYNFNFHAGIAGQTGTNAFYLSLGHAIVIPNLLDKKRKSKRIFNIILFLILLWALFLTGKRGLLLANFFAIAILYYISNRDKMISKIKKFTRYVLFLLLFAFVIYISYLYVPAVNHLLFRFFDNSLYTLSGDISSGRFNLYRLAWKTFLSNPIMGVGIDAFIYVPYAGSSRNIGAHNDWLQLLAEIGILGTVLFTITILTVFQKTVRLCNNSRTYRKYRPFLYASLYCQSFILIDSLTGMPFHNYSMLLTYMIFISIPYAVQNKLTSQRVFNSI
jgi:O-antigen ligase